MTAKTIKILLIEDNADHVHFIKRALNGLDMELSHEADGQAGLDMLGKMRPLPEVVLLDYRLPRMDGLEILRLIKQRKLRTGCIFLTADTNIETAVEAMKAGAADFLPKTGKFYDQLPDMVNKVFEQVCMLRDKTQYEAALRESEEKFRMLADNIPGAIYLCKNDEQYTMLYLNSYIEELTGYKKEDFIEGHLHYSQLIEAEDQEMVREEINQATAARQSFRLEYRIRTRSGESKWIGEYGVGIFKDEHLDHLEGYLFDITQRRLNENRVRESEAKWRDSFNSLDDIMLVLDRDMTIENINRAGAKLLKMDKEDVIGQKCYHVFCKENKEAHAHCQLSKPGNMKAAVSFIMPRCSTFGQRDYSVKTTPIIDEKGEVVKYVELIRDITELKQAENALRKSETRLKYALEAANEGFMDWHLMSGDIYFSPYFSTLLGYPEGGLENRDRVLHDIIHPEDKTRFLTLIEETIEDNKGAYDTEIRMKTRDGHWQWLSAKGKIVEKDERDNPIRLIGTIADIADRKKVENLLKIERSLGLKLGSTSDMMDALETSLESVFEIDGPDVGGIYLFNDLTGDLELACNKGLPKDFTETAKRFDKGSDHVRQMKVGRPVFEKFDVLVNHMGELGHSIHRLKLGIRGVAALPLKHKNRVIGSLTVGSYVYRNFPDYAKYSLENISMQIGDALGRIKTDQHVQNLAMIVETTNDAIMAQNTEGIITSWNKSAEEMYGYKAEETIGRHASMFLPADRKEEMDKIIHLVTEGHKFERTETVHVRKDGREMNVSLSISHMRNPAGQVTGASILGRNITERIRIEKELEDYRQDLEAKVQERTEKLSETNEELKAINETLEEEINERLKVADELKAAKNAAESANQAKSMFLANMSHEIRTPLNAVIGFTDILNSLITEPEQKNYIESISSSGRSLLMLINDILDLSKIEAKQLKLQYEPVNMEYIIADIRNIFSLKIAEKNLELIVDIAPDLPGYLFLDEIRIRQMLFNLIGNAIKFTDSGYIMLSVKSESPAKGYDMTSLIISVKDTGIGIAQEQQKTIFEVFRQQEAQSTKKYGGTGLGLSITRRLAEMMDGHIEVDSQPGKGSEFRIKLHNIKITQGNEVPVIEEPDFNPDDILFEPAKLMVVDDRKMNRNLLKIYFSHSNFEIIEAENGEEAIEKARVFKPDLILMDKRMPLLNGDEAARRLKKEEGFESLKVIALSASVKPYKEEELKDAGFDAYLHKPVRKEVLFRELTRFLPYSLSVPGIETSDQPESLQLNPLESLSPEQCRDFVDVLDNQLLPEWKVVREPQFIDEVEDFARLVEKLAEQYQFQPLLTYARALMTMVNTFDIEKIRRHLADYPRIADQIKEKAKECNEQEN